MNRLLLYSPVFPPQVGGIETVVQTLALGLAGLKTSLQEPEFDLTVVTPAPAGDLDDSVMPFRISRMPGIFRIWRLIRAADVIHIATPAVLPLILGLLAQKPVVIEHHGFQFVCPNGQLLIEPSQQPCPGHFIAGRHANCLRCHPRGKAPQAWKRWLVTFLKRFLCRHAAVNIMPTQWLLETLGLHNAVTIWHGIDVPAAKDPVDAAARPPQIAFQGRLVNSKGMRLLLEAAQCLNSRGLDFEVVVIGHGPERGYLEKRASDLNLHGKVRFLGRLSNAEMYAALKPVYAVVVPSLAGEVFGLVVAENMARAAAVVASNLGAFAEVLGDAGLTFRVGDAADLADKLQRLLEMPALEAELGQRARRRVAACFSREIMVEEHAKIYRLLTAQTSFVRRSLLRSHSTFSRKDRSHNPTASG